MLKLRTSAKSKKKVICNISPKVIKDMMMGNKMTELTFSVKHYFQNNINNHNKKVTYIHITNHLGKIKIYPLFNFIKL